MPGFVGFVLFAGRELELDALNFHSSPLPSIPRICFILSGQWGIQLETCGPASF